jgi:hypothetical protein
MGAFFGFIVRHWIMSILVVLSVMSNALGYWQQGAEIWEAGPPAWAFQIVGYVLFVGVVTSLLYEWDKKVQALSVGEAPQKPDPAKLAEERRQAEHDAALRQINKAIDDADWEDLEPDPDSIDTGLATLESAFTTVRKLYAIQTPRLSERRKGSLQVGVRFLRQIRPFLVAGHIEEARSTASDLLRPYEEG